MFTNVRVRLQRLVDLKFFNGWVTNFAGKEIYVRFSPPISFEPGDSFHFTVSGYDVCAQFTAVVFKELGEEVLFSVATPIVYSKPQEEVRYAIDGVMGIIFDQGVEYGFEVADVSRKGLGGFVQGNLTRGIEVTFKLESTYGAINGTGEVRYCRTDPQVVTRNRVGLRINSIGRIDSARWQKLLGEEVAF